MANITIPRNAKELLLLVAATGLLVLGFYWLKPFSPPRVNALKMTAGDAAGLRHKLALELANEAARVGIPIDVQPTDGSEAAIEGLISGKFDLAFVQGGLASENVPGVRQLTAMHIEPLHLVVKPVLFERIEQNGLKALSGCQVNLGPAGSGTQILASEVLAFAGLHPENDPKSLGNQYRALAMKYSELLDLPANALPDAVFTVSSLPSPIADFLIETHNFRLVPLSFGEALALESFLQLGTHLVSGSIDKRHLFETRIPAFTYSVNLAEPPQPITTIGTRLLLTANEQVSNEVVARLLDTLFDSDFAHAERPPLAASLLDLPPEYPMHAGSLQYRQRNKPLIAGDAIDYWEKIVAITATMAGGTFFMLQWYLRWSRRKREASFASYMKRVIAIENASMQNEFSAQLDLAELIRLQRELAELKAEAVRKFADGELEGEGLIQGFLALVNDARNQLTRLILHQRDNIEERASRQQVDADAIWLAQSNAAQGPPQET